MGNSFITKLIEIKFEILRVYIFEKYFTTEKLLCALPVFWK